MAVTRPLTILALALSAQPAAALGAGVLRGQSTSGRWQILEALHLRSPQSPGPTSVPTSAGPVTGDTAAGDATDAPGAPAAATTAPDATTTAPTVPALNETEPSAQTAAPRFDAGIKQVDLEAHSARAEDTLVDSLELAQVGEMKRVVFRALSQLRAAQIKEFDSIAKLQTGAIDQFNDNFNFRNAYKVNYTMDEGTDEDLPVFLPGEEPWWSAPGGPDWTRQLDNATAEDRRGRPAYRKPKQGLPGQTADGAPCICYPELLEVGAPSEDDPASLALAAIRACCAGPDAVVRRAGRRGV